MSDATLSAGREAEGTWRDIGTAPKDGTPIIGFRADHYARFGHMQITWWRQAKDRAGYIGWGEFNDNFWPPTHWMPLPVPPIPATPVSGA